MRTQEFVKDVHKLVTPGSAESPYIADRGLMFWYKEIKYNKCFDKGATEIGITHFSA